MALGMSRESSGAHLRLILKRFSLHKNCGVHLFELAWIEVADLDRVDVYSCFPSAVQIAAKELGLDENRPLTITGGLTFGGGPLNNYVMHSMSCAHC